MTPGPISPRTVLASPLVTSPLEHPQPRRRSSGGIARRAAPAVAPLSTIPNVYFEEDFHLENPRTFDIVSERAEIARPSSAGQNGAVVSSGRKALATNAILQEKLSWYMDTVEIHLISSIATASSSFFAALGSLKELHSEAAQSVAQIKSLREGLARIDQEMAQEGLKLVTMRQRRENMQKLSDAIAQLQQVVEAIQRCDAQVEQGKVEEALDGLVDVTNLMEGRPAMSQKTAPGSGPVPVSQPIDLRSLRALDGILSDVAALRRRIGKSFETRFIQTLIGDVRQHVDSTAPTVTFQRWDKASNRNRHGRSPSVFPAYLHIEPALRSDLLAHLKGLARSDTVVLATVAYRELLLREIKNLIRRQLPSSSDDDTESTVSVATQDTTRLSSQEKSSILARNLRALDPEDAESMLKKIYANVGEALRRLGTQVKLLLDMTSTLANPPPRSPLKSPRVMSPDGRPQSEFFDGPGTPTVRHDEIQQALDLSGLLGQAVDIAQSQITKVLKVRSDQSTRLELPQFLRYFTLNRLFADECEAVSGRGGASLKTVVNTHIKDFVHHFAETERQKLIEAMDSDSWEAKDFSDADSARLTRILDSSTREIEAWNKDSEIWQDQQPKTLNGHVSSPQQPIANGSSLRAAADTPPQVVRSAVIDEQKYVLPASAPAALAGIEAFAHLLSGIPSLTPETCTLLCDYLKLFNSRSSQLILGAGATRSAGLKNITAKHLAISSQALSFVIALIPHVREFVRRRPGSSGLMIEFDKLKRLLQEHQTGIHDKLVDIMSGRAQAHVGSMRKIEWDKGGGGGDGVSAYMQALIKETTTLHRVLSKHLPENTVQAIMVPVLQSYREQLGKAFGDVRVETKGGKERWVFPIQIGNFFFFHFICRCAKHDFDCVCNRMLRDADFFKTRMAKIEGNSGLGDFILTIVGNKPVEGPKEIAAAATAATTTPAAEGNGEVKVASSNGVKEGSS